MKINPEDITPKMYELLWFEDEGDWCALSVNCFDEDGDDRMKYRLKLVGDQWTEDSDDELMTDPYHPRSWPTLEEAKGALQEDEKAAVIASAEEGLLESVDE